MILDISWEIDCSKEPHFHSRVGNRTQRITTNTGIMVPGLNTKPNQWKTPLCHTDASHGNMATLNSPGEVYPWIPSVCHLKSPSQQPELRTRTHAVLWMCFLFWREHVAVPPTFPVCTFRTQCPPARVSLCHPNAARLCVSHTASNDLNH